METIEKIHFHFWHVVLVISIGVFLDVKRSQNKRRALFFQYTQEIKLNSEVFLCVRVVRASDDVLEAKLFLNLLALYVVIFKSRSSLNLEFHLSSIVDEIQQLFRNMQLRWLMCV